MSSPASPDLAQRIRQANIRLHDRKAQEFDREEVHMHKPRLQRRTDELAAFVLERVRSPRPRLLDLGCGTGNWSLRFAPHGYDITGLDISAGMLEVYRRKLAGRARTVHSDVDAFLAQNEDRFDVIAFSAVLHHLPDYAATLARAAARLTPGGLLVIHHEHRHARDVGRATRFIEHLDIRLYGIAYKWRHHRADFLPAIRRKLGLTPRHQPAGQNTGDDIRYADYHVFAGGVSEHQVIATLEAQGLRIVRHDTYQQLRLGALNALANLSRLHGLFSLVAAAEA